MFLTASYQDNLLQDLCRIEQALEGAQDNPGELDHLLLSILEFGEKIMRVLKGTRMGTDITLLQTSDILMGLIDMLKEIYTQETYTRVDIFLARVRILLDSTWSVDIPEPIPIIDAGCDRFQPNLSDNIIDVGCLRNKCSRVYPEKTEFVQLLRKFVSLKLVIESLVRRFPGDTALPVVMKIPHMYNLVRLYTRIQARDPRGQAMIVYMLHSMLESLRGIQGFIATKKTTV